MSEKEDAIIFLILYVSLGILMSIIGIRFKTTPIGQLALLGGIVILGSFLLGITFFMIKEYITSAK